MTTAVRTTGWRPTHSPDNGVMPEPAVTPAALAAAETGVDLAQIEARLRLSPAERFRQGVQASRRMIELRERARPAGVASGR